MPSFQSPEWFLLLPVFAVAGWYWKSLRLGSPLRVLCLLLLVALLVRPQIDTVRKGMDLWVLLDRSESSGQLVDAGFPEWKRLLEKARPSRDDNLLFVDYAGEVIPQLDSDSEIFAGDPKLTRTSLALQNTLARVDPDKPSRILVFTDGYATEPLGTLGEKLLGQQTPLDYRLLRAEDAVDYQVRSLTLPSRVQISEPFAVEIAVRGNKDARVPLRIYRNGELLKEADLDILDGEGVARFSDRIAKPGAYAYTATIAPVEDAHFGNNTFDAWIEIAGGPRVLLVTKYLDDPVARSLEAQGFAVETVNEPGTLAIGQLAGARAVVLNNIPAYEVPSDFLASLDFFVREQGGGFLMVGGKQSFGAGAYYQSAVDELLPVTMELKDEHRKLSVAMAIVMDRSGSMGMTVAGGRMKMDLANEGAARAVELLGGADLISVFAVDSEPDTIVPLRQVGAEREDILNRIRRILPGGGGIYVHVGMKRGWDELKSAPVGLRHMILFSDAQDSEEPGDYKGLIAEMVANGGTVSVIGLGTERDSDADLLKDIAARGNGRIFFTEDAVELPNIFAQETVTAARSAFVSDPVNTSNTGRWFEIAGGGMDWPESVDGYNLSYLRPKDSAAVLSADEYAAPLVAFGNRGIGRTAAVSFPLGGEFSGRVRAWPAYGDFVQTLGRWLMGEDLPPGVGMRSRLEGTLLTVDLFHDPSWEPRFAEQAPRIMLAEGGDAARSYEVVWRKLAPGRYSATVDLEEGIMVRGAVQVGKSALPFGPVVVGTRTEWAFDEERVAELKATSRQSGGGEILDLRDAWKRPHRIVRADIRLPLLLALLLAILLDALVTRTGWRLPEFSLAGIAANARSRNRGKARSRAEREARLQREAAARAAAEEASRAATRAASSIAPTPEELGGRPKPKREAAEERAARFKRAKRGGK